jgi:hypothetical protein
MKKIRLVQKYRCGFCKRTGLKSAIETHEKRCFRNPNRFCDYCQNRGFTMEEENDLSYKLNCPYCESFDKEKLKQIQEREALKSPPPKGS